MMREHSRRREEKRAARKRERDVEKLIKRGARHIADAGQLVRYQMSMLARFANGDVPMERWRDLKRCRAGRCSSTPCSAACWFGDRGKVNDLILAAARFLKGSEKTLHFVTIIDPHYAAPAGQLASVSINGILSSLRRRFREAGDLFEGDPAFGFIEAAMEMLPDGRFVWFVHVHLVLASDASRNQVRDALRPPRDMPDPQEWGRKRWKSVVVKAVSDLTNLLAYFGKRLPEANRMQVSEQDERSRWPARLRPEHHLEYDLWLLAQRPSDRIFKRGMKEVHGKLMEMSPRA